MTTFDFQELKQSVLTEINRVRADPGCYIPILENHKTLFKGDILYRKSGNPIQTAEGAAVYTEAIKFLHRQNAVHTLTFDEQLSEAAESHVKDMGIKGLISHDGSDGKTPSDRIEEFCEWNETCGENIDVASRTGIDVVVAFLVDDGIKDRGDRLNLFKTEFKYIGIGCGFHRDYETMVVIDFVGGLREKGKPFFDHKNYKYEFPKDINSAFRRDEESKTNVKYKNKYQLTDKDAPNNTVSVKLTKKTKLYEGKKVSITKKYYTLEDGTQHIVEIEEF